MSALGRMFPGELQRLHRIAGEARRTIADIERWNMGRNPKRLIDASVETKVLELVTAAIAAHRDGSKGRFVEAMDRLRTFEQTLGKDG